MIVVDKYRSVAEIDPFNRKWQTILHCIPILVFVYVTCPLGLLAAHPQPQSNYAGELLNDADKTELVSQIRSAEAIARRMQSLGSEQLLNVSREEEFHVLRMLQVAADDRLVTLRTDPEFQDATESMLWETLRAGRGNVPINNAIFEIIRFLPDSEKLTDIVSMAFSQGASPSKLWLDRVYEKLAPHDIERIRSRVRAAPVGTVLTWELAVLAIDGSAASQSVLEALLDQARTTERRNGRRTFGPTRVRELEHMATLHQARLDSTSLIQWGVSSVRSGNSPSGLWAFEEVLRRVGKDSEIWRHAWHDLETAVWDAVDQQTPLTVTTPAARAQRSDVQRRVASSILVSWVEWADRNGVVVPTPIRELVEAFRSLIPHATGC